MPSNIKTCLWFHSNGLAAAQFYTSLIPNSRITSAITSEQPLVVEFTLNGVPYQILNGGPHFTLNESVSIVLETEDQAQTDAYWYALIDQGGEESQCGWLKDRFGVSWQIVPKPVIARLTSHNKNGAQRAMQKLLTMKRLIIADIEQAFLAEDTDN